MLKGLHPLLTPNLLWALASMGHGDEVAVVDAHHPAQAVARSTIFGRPIRLPGARMEEAVRAILSVMPLDHALPESARRMEVMGDPDAVPPVQAAVQAEIDAAVGAPVPLVGLEREAFYAAARAAFAVVQVGDARVYGCILLRKGVAA